MKSALITRLMKLAVAGAAILAGCESGGYATPDYGVPRPTEPPDPELELIDLTYEPASPVELGAQLTFHVTANKPFTEHQLYVAIAEYYSAFDAELLYWLTAWLHDDGIPPDVTAGDAVFTGKLTLPWNMGAHEGLPVIARVEWWSSAPAPEITGEPLTVVEPED